MIENLGRKVFWIAALLVAALLCIVLPEAPFRLGLDLQGGTRYLLSIDFEQALKDGKISQAEYDDPQQLLQDTIAVIRERIDPHGQLEATIRVEGTRSFVVEVPSTAMRTQIDARLPLAERLDPAMKSGLLLDAPDAELVRDFPLTGGVVKIGDERIRYEIRDGNELRELTRGYAASPIADHPPGSAVVLRGDDTLLRSIQNPGSLQIFVEAKAERDFAQDTDLTKEREKAQKWVDDNPDLSLSAYNALNGTPQGPPANIRWFPHHVMEGDPVPARRDNLVPLLVQPADRKWSFSGVDVSFVRSSADDYGLPAVSIDMDDSARFRFGDFTTKYVRELMGIVINDEIISLATIREPLVQGSFQISGGSRGFRKAEVDEMVKVLKTGSLRVKPELEQSERVGATLGDQYVRSGAISAALGLGVVLLFTMAYYRRLGVFAAISLLVGMTLLMGVMAFLQATLTLPGVAGIILTLGMAVDANILIYERIREESAKGRKLIQASKNGFERAATTIIDANVTTFITAAILYFVGTGPVRGFATTLMIGIVTSVFAALVVTRVLVHVAIAKGVERFGMSQLVRETKIGFMGMWKVALPASLAVIVVGLGLFLSLPDHKKLSIDFLGGLTVTARTEDPQQPDTIRRLIAGIPSVIGKSAEVQVIKDSGDPKSGYRRFRITYKSEGDVVLAEQQGEETDTGERTGEAEIREALRDVLQKGPIELQLDLATMQASGSLYFEGEHEAADVQGALEVNGTLAVASVAPVADHRGVYTFRGTAKAGSNEVTLQQEIGRRFTQQSDSKGAEYVLAQPVPETSLVGAQVVGELRDKAIMAILLSLFAAVMYIRVRFAEYSYGLAAVVALVHDVLIVLGVLALADMTGFVDGEISLPMIAAFLTIIGYSLNDTIIVFDRVRENLPRVKGTMAEILDLSINQTLSRTLLTSGTTLMAVAVLFVFNRGGGSVLEGFSFAMLIGVLVGTYSSIFVASPVLLWLERRAARHGHKRPDEAAAA